MGRNGMGDKITRPAKPAELQRAKFLQQALQRRTPALSLPEDAITVNPAAIPSFLSDSSDVQKAYLDQLVECAPEAISILDEQYRIRGINGEFTRLFGFLAGEDVGRRSETLIVPPDRNAETQWLGEILDQGEKVKLETKRRRKDGTLVDVFLSGAQVIISGKQVAVYVLYRDMSEQKRAESLSSALYRIAEKTSSAIDLQQFYAAIHGIVGELMYARNFYIALYDQAAQLLSFPYFVDEEDPTPAPKRLGHGLTEYVLRTGEPLLCTPDVFDVLVKRAQVELIGAPSLDWLGVPLEAGNTTFGVLVVQSYTD